ncbi:MAG: T9SS type A sorting domain-containing protein [Bacteroidota bacterium]
MRKRGQLYAIVHIILFYLITTNVSGNGLNSILKPNLSSHNIYLLETPVAVNDTFVLPVSCINNVVTGSVLKNDIFGSNTNVKIEFVIAPKVGILSFNTKGKFIYLINNTFRGQIYFSYRLSNVDYPELYSDGSVYIIVADDYDCDKVADIFDIDDDNDGILDIHEGEGITDSDKDGIPDSFDIDSDNDGITDFMEWQSEDIQISILETDQNGDGWDDAFDPSLGGKYYEQTDTDNDGTPDFLDNDSDNDKIDDSVEGFDSDEDGEPDITRLKSDTDKDGLDDAFDIVSCWSHGLNSAGSNSPLPDINANGVRDWREANNAELPGEGNNLSISPEELLVYPNPVINNCTVEIPQETEMNKHEVRLIDLSGKILIQKKSNHTQFKLNLGNLNPGLYLLNITTTGKSYSTRIFKTN